MIAGLRTLIPAALLLAAWPLGEVGGAAVGAFGLSPVAFLAVLVGFAAAIGAAGACGVRPTVARAAAGGFPLPVTANRVRAAAALAAFGAAALTAIALSDEVRTRWDMFERETLKQEIFARPGGEDLWYGVGYRQGLQFYPEEPFMNAATDEFVQLEVPELQTFKFATYQLDALHTRLQQPDSYLRSVIDRARLPPRDWVRWGVSRGILLFAGLLAAAVAWRGSRVHGRPAAERDE